jgi:hypothetical protein
MKFESLPPDPPARRFVHYDVTYHGDVPVFVIEALDIRPEDPRFWVEGEDGVLHHSTAQLLVFPSLAVDIRSKIAQVTHIIVEEKYQRHHNQGLTPWGMDRVSPGILYEAPIIPVPTDLSLKNIFPAT